MDEKLTIKSNLQHKRTAKMQITSPKIPTTRMPTEMKPSGPTAKKYVPSAKEPQSTSREAAFKSVARTTIGLEPIRREDTKKALQTSVDQTKMSKEESARVDSVSDLYPIKDNFLARLLIENSSW